MSKYRPLWDYIKDTNKDNLTFSFKEIENIVGFSLDHSFLTYKKELLSYGFEVEKISMKQQTVSFKKAKKDKLIIYVHGQFGSASEAERYKPLFKDFDVFGLDYKSQTPWDAEKEFPKLFEKITDGYKSVILVANSIGAYFSMTALSEKAIQKAFFISPVVDMGKLINDMMSRAGVTETKLYEKGEIQTDSGETLSKKYLDYAKKQKIVWHTKTYILYGEKDNLTSFDAIKKFSEKTNAELTVCLGGEHWFHTDEQLNFLDKWIVENLQK